jgi:Glycosyl hydrolase family 26
VTGKRARVCACALVALTAIAVARASAEGVPAANCGTLLPPRAGAYFGAFPDFNRPPTVTEDDVQAAKIDAFVRRSSHRLAWVSFTQSWYRGLAFPRDRVLTIWRSGAVPYIAFLPDSGVFYGAGRRQEYPERRFALQRIIDRGFDRPLRAWARAARDSNIPLLMSFGAEVNDEWGPWSARWNGADETAGYGDPAFPDGAERFRDAYRHVVTLFRGEGATNVTWFFHADTYPPHNWWNTLDWYYPGDAYVDWLGISGYGSLSADGPVVNFDAKVEASGVYRVLTGLSARPMAVVEMGVVDGPDRVKPEWIRRAFAALRSGRYPRIKGAVWWDWGDGEIDTRIDSSPAALAAFRTGVQGRFFDTRPRFTGTCAPGRPRGLRSADGSGAAVVRLMWSPVPNAAWYEVFRDGSRIATTAVSRYEDPLAARGRRYRYAVRAVNPLGRSSLSRAAIGFRAP